MRDDGSTDGSADFVEKNYAAEISSGKIKLKRNEKNLGEDPTTIRLFLDAAGKYFSVLHSDDMYLPHALKYLYETAEKFQADIVHTIRFLNSPPDGVIKEGTQFQIMSPESQKVDTATVMPADQLSRFKEFFLLVSFLRGHSIHFFSAAISSWTTKFYWTPAQAIYTGSFWQRFMSRRRKFITFAATRPIP